MKITIDTKEDSHSDIRKIIRLLKHLIGEDSYSNYEERAEEDRPKHKNIFEDSTPGVGGGLFGMFGSAEPKKGEDSPSKNSIWDEKEDDPKIEFYGF